MTAAIATKAAVCRHFGVAWDQYGSLTVREHRVLVDMLRDAARLDAPPGMTRVE